MVSPLVKNNTVAPRTHPDIEAAPFLAEQAGVSPVRATARNMPASFTRGGEFLPAADAGITIVVSKCRRVLICQQVLRSIICFSLIAEVSVDPLSASLIANNPFYNDFQNIDNFSCSSKAKKELENYWQIKTLLHILILYNESMTD